MKSSPKKRFGQHFLRDTGVLERILRYLMPSPEDVFLEIGAGLGALSERLGRRVARLVAVELDIDCIPPLMGCLAPYPTSFIIEGDVLQLDLAECLAPHLDSQQSLRIAGNLPYNIATAIIEKLLDLSLPIRDMTFLIQWEVAQRITAKPGTRQYGYFSVLCQRLAITRMGFKVMPGSFFPKPKVISALVQLEPFGKPRQDDLDHAFTRIAKAAFGHRRKTLANSLKHHPEIEPVCANLLAGAGIDGSRRAEELSVHEYETLAITYRDILRSTNPADPVRN